MTVGRILAAKGRRVVTIEPDRSVSDAVALLARAGIGALIVADSGDHVRGVFSERDLVRLIAARGPGALQDHVSAWMTCEVVTTCERASVHSLMSQMTEGRFRHLPVMEGESLVGLVSIGDVVKQRLAEMESEQQALRDYIASA
jgi:CBS domain-containing protein